MRVLLLLFGLSLVFVPSAAHAALRHVSINGSDTGNDCSASGSPCRTIGHAIDQAARGDEILVATGAYVEHFTVETDLTIRGGYTPDFTSIVSDSPELTIVDGQGIDRVVTVDGGGNAIRVVVSNLQLQNGLAQTASTLTRFGGGALVTGGAILELSDVIITRCDASDGSGTGFGGGLAVVDGEATVRSSEISSCEANAGLGVGQGRGGGIYVAGRFGAGNALLTMTGSEVTANAAQGSRSSAGSAGNAGYGGGLFFGEADSARVTLRDNLWTSNTARQLGTPPDEGRGGAIYVQGGSQPVHLDAEGDEFLTNRASFSQGNSAIDGSTLGGGVCLYASAEGTLFADFRNVVFDTNTAVDDPFGDPIAQGGGLYTRFADVAVSGTRFVDNVALVTDSTNRRGQGGAIYQNDGFLEMDSSLVERNVALEGSGSVDVGSDSQGGGVASLGPGRLEMRNCFLIDNRASLTIGNGNAIHLGSDATAQLQHLTVSATETTPRAAIHVAPTGNVTTDVVVQNTIVTNHENGIVNDSATEIVQMQNCLFDAVDVVALGQVLDTGTQPYLEADPLFVNPASGDHRLLEDSPAIDAGLALAITVDFDGEMRPMGDAHDIGADEFFVEDVVSVSAPRDRGTALLANIPNPFNPSTLVRFRVGRTGPVTISIHDAAGRRVRTFPERVLRAGSHQVRWDGTDATGRTVASGVYLVRMESVDGTDARRITLVK